MEGYYRIIVIAASKLRRIVLSPTSFEAAVSTQASGVRIDDPKLPLHLREFV